ncbi:NADPH-dependent 1-acyl dihydroxyacetone phosphate reductase [Exophiala xenobiotica]|uniref:NADPH-dependent 1-acyl dihydroxyacetone phosphate reductase n=1 Tax=Lithohypha guttulata TaxID=1690604 RepID=A0ABR0JV39_9EURO|nr:NADPH-dependent 1-acyl dihydroxyacetone phosphate reductase [Lithohypha guttulata]KAK5309644.1 NADPH-dependent 1-acyl dihydroxyacetone phosphate reductase [Exophiala xenobiotica]
MVEAEISEVEKLFDLNVWSIIRTTRHFVPLLRNSKTGALLVNNTSGNSIMPMPFQGPYNASKAAAAMVTQNLPFGIKVIDLKTGAVKSHFHENSTTRVNPVLPENSLYTPAKEKMESIFRGEININLMPAEEYAKRVVNDLSKDNPPLIIWRGDSATKAWLASFAPLGFTDGLLKKISGLDVVEQILKAKVGKKTD